MTTEELAGLGTEGSKALGKLSDLIKQSTIPNVTKRQTKALLNDVNKKMELIRNNPDMDISFQGDIVSVKQLLPGEIEERAKIRLISKAIRQQENFECIIENTYNDLQFSEECSDEPVDMDWWTCFEKHAEDISNKDMQVIWGKILSGEIQNPGTFSIRTLNDIKSINKKEAEAFQKILPFVFSLGKNNSDDLFLIQQSEAYEKHNILIDDFMVLDEAGLIRNNSGLTIRVKNDMCIFYYSQDYKISVCYKKSQYSEIDDLIKAASFQIINLTRTGVQLYKTLQVSDDIDFVTDVLSTSKKKINEILSIRINKYNKTTGLYELTKTI